ncbi:hypothetical protein F0U59_23510 [Archangium gephyra]|nr:hypothetical protein F0U59_23510 [Archangium gephyra]
MSQQNTSIPVQKPSLGRVVLFTRDDYKGMERVADIVGIDPSYNTLTLHVKTADPSNPIIVDVAPIEEGAKDEGGRRWRWPPRV